VSQNIRAFTPKEILSGPERSENPWLTEFVCLKHGVKQVTAEKS